MILKYTKQADGTCKIEEVKKNCRRCGMPMHPMLSDDTCVDCLGNLAEMTDAERRALGIATSENAEFFTKIVAEQRRIWLERAQSPCSVLLPEPK